MADLADCMDMLALIAEQAVFPNGLDQPSVLGPAVQVPDPTNPSGPYVWSNTVDIAQGWPMVDSLDPALKIGRSTVTVFAVPGTTSVITTPLDFSPGTLSEPTHGMIAAGTDTGFSLAGRPGIGEYATVILDRTRSYSYAAQAGDLPETVCQYLANAIAADYPGTARTGQSVTIPGFISLVVRIGAPYTIGHIIGRQKQQFRVTVWSPNPQDRTTVARALDIAYRRNLRVTFPDTSQGFITYQGSNLSDERQNVNIYRRDVIVFVQWDSVDTYPAYEVTAVNVGLDLPGAPQSISF